MSIINANKSREIEGGLPKTEPIDKRGDTAEIAGREEVIKRLREQELKLKYIEEKGLINSEVEKTKVELAKLIKELEALNV